MHFACVTHLHQLIVKRIIDNFASYVNICTLCNALKALFLLEKCNRGVIFLARKQPLTFLTAANSEWYKHDSCYRCPALKHADKRICCFKKAAFTTNGNSTEASFVFITARRVVCLSVHLSVCHMPVLCQNGYTYDCPNNATR